MAMGEKGNKPIEATGTGAIAVSYAPQEPFEVEEIRLHLDSAATTSENLTVTQTAGAGSDYDTILLKRDLSVGDVVDLVWRPPGDKPYKFEFDDSLDIAYTNTDGNTYGLQVFAKKSGYLG